MRYLTLGEVLELHRRIIQQTGGASGVRNLAALESTVLIITPASNVKAPRWGPGFGGKKNIGGEIEGI